LLTKCVKIWRIWDLGRFLDDFFYFGSMAVF
jgi:hypothetical protein